MMVSCHKRRAAEEADVVSTEISFASPTWFALDPEASAFQSA